MEKGKDLIRIARTNSEVVDGLDIIIQGMKVGQKIKLKELTTKVNKTKLIIDILKEKIESGELLVIGSNYDAFRKD
jgi:hypothetical protein